MQPDPRYHWNDRAAMRALIEHVGLGALFAATPEGPKVTHVPVVMLDEDRIGFHLSRHNALARHITEGEVLFVVQGPHGYVSPDWYGMADQVPTWNYSTVEVQGRVTRMDRDALIDLIDRVSTHHERQLAPKAVWTRDKMAAGLFERMLGGVIGFTLHGTQWHGTAKLGQNKPKAARESVAQALEAQGQQEIAANMRDAPA